MSNKSDGEGSPDGQFEISKYFDEGFGGTVKLKNATEKQKFQNFEEDPNKLEFHLSQYGKSKTEVISE